MMDPYSGMGPIYVVFVALAIIGAISLGTLAFWGLWTFAKFAVGA